VASIWAVAETSHPFPRPPPPTRRSRHASRRWQWLDQSANLTDPRVVAITAGVAPAMFRVGGITGDWTHYMVPNAHTGSSGE